MKVRTLIGLILLLSFGSFASDSQNYILGAGDKIEIKKSSWITTFKGLTVHSEDDNRWAVKKDGGQFDQFTGATITPRAVVNSVKNAVLFAQNEFDTIFTAPNSQCEEVSQ